MGSNPPTIIQMHFYFDQSDSSADNLWYELYLFGTKQTKPKIESLF